VVANNAVIQEVRQAAQRDIAERTAYWISQTPTDCSSGYARSQALAHLSTLKRLFNPPAPAARAAVESVLLVGTNGSGILREAVSATDVAEVQSPREDAFTRNDPNPFVSRTQIRFTVEHDGPVSLRIYDVRGREVETLVDEFRTSGVHAVDWDAKDRPSGIYFYRLTAGDSEETRKMVLLR
jgi:hypothetical protein